MNRNIIFLLLMAGWFCMPAANQAQKVQESSSIVTLADLEMKTCSIDSAAPAFVLFDKGETAFVHAEGSLDVVYTRTLRIKIVHKAGIRFGELSIPLYVGYTGEVKQDKILNLSAFTYNLSNGNIIKTKVDPKTVFEQKVSDHYILVKFAFPDVHEGSLLDIRYEVRSPFVFRLNDWVFQWEIPVIYSECVLKYTPFYLYTYLLKNASKFDEYQEYQVEGPSKMFYNTSYREGACKFVMKNVPAFTETDYISAREEYLMTLHFQLNKVTNTRGVSETLCSTWDELAKMLSEEDTFGKYISSGKNASGQILEDEKIPGMPQAERFDAIVTWVKTNFSWDEQNRMYAGGKPKDLLKRKTGTSAEINLFLCGMLRAAEIEAWPVLISTRGSAKAIKDYPFLDFFNYVMVIAKIGDKWVLTDGTEPFCGNSSFPSRCINGKGLLVKEDKTLWVDISPKGISSIEDRIRLQFNAGNDSLNAHITLMAKGYSGLALRKTIGKDPGKAIAYFSDTGLDAGDSVVICNAAADSVMKPFIIRVNGKIPVEITDQMLVIDPFCNLAIKTNPFDKSSRKYPVDLIYPKSKTLIMELIIPEGYRIRKIPESFSREDDLMTFAYTSQVDENRILFHAFYATRNPVYTPEEYLLLQQFYDDIVKKLNEKVYLEKIT